MVTLSPDFPSPELEAAWTVAAMLSGLPKRRDTKDAPPMTHDFDIHLNGLKTVALEVTSSVIEEVAMFQNELKRRQFDTSTLDHDWSINVLHPVAERQFPRVKNLQFQLVPLLEIIERNLPSGVTDVMRDIVDSTVPEVTAAIDGLKRLGVRVANPLPKWNSKDAQVAIGTGGLLRRVPFEELVANVVRDNLVKLKLADADQRQVFVWVTPSDMGNSAQMSLDQVPSTRVEIDATIDVVWFGLWSPRPNAESLAMRLWSASNAAGWMAHTIPLTRTYANNVRRESLS